MDFLGAGGEGEGWRDEEGESWYCRNGFCSWDILAVFLYGEWWILGAMIVEICSTCGERILVRLGLGS